MTPEQESMYQAMRNPVFALMTQVNLLAVYATSGEVREDEVKYYAELFGVLPENIESGNVYFLLTPWDLAETFGLRDEEPDGLDFLDRMVPNLTDVERNREIYSFLDCFEQVFDIYTQRFQRGQTSWQEDFIVKTIIYCFESQYVREGDNSPFVFEYLERIACLSPEILTQRVLEGIRAGESEHIRDRFWSRVLGLFPVAQS